MRNKERERERARRNQGRSSLDFLDLNQPNRTFVSLNELQSLDDCIPGIRSRVYRDSYSLRFYLKFTVGKFPALLIEMTKQSVHSIYCFVSDKSLLLSRTMIIIIIIDKTLWTRSGFFFSNYFLMSLIQGFSAAQSIKLIRFC